MLFSTVRQTACGPVEISQEKEGRDTRETKRMWGREEGLKGITDRDFKLESRSRVERRTTLLASGFRSRSSL